VQVDGFLLEGSPEPFDEDVVEITTAAIHSLPGSGWPATP
jgi:hypothetical protein